MRKSKTTEELELDKTERKAIRRIKQNGKKRKMSKADVSNTLAFIFGGGSSDEVQNGAPIGKSIGTMIKTNTKCKTHKPQNSKEYKDEDLKIRQQRGLATRLPNVDYSAHEVNGRTVKRCACCQKVWDKSNYSMDSYRDDRMKNTCKDCDRLRNKTRIYIPTSERKKMVAAEA